MFGSWLLVLSAIASCHSNVHAHDLSSETLPPSSGKFLTNEWHTSPRSSCASSNASSPLIPERTSNHIKSLIEEWNSTGLAVSVVQKLAPMVNSSIPQWKIEYGSYGLAKTSSQEIVTPDTLFAIASNSKLFLSISVGLILSNATLAASFQNRSGKKLGWWTKMKDLMPEEWVIQDDDIEQGATIQDLLSHRTGLPRHDFSGTGTRRDTREAITTLRYLRSSATFRQTFQYNNLMYETLSYLPTLFLNQTYETYIQQHLFDPLNMTSTTFNVARAEGELGHQLAEGHLQHLRDMTRGEKGWLKPIIPYFSRPGEEKIWAGAGGVISSARDLSMWVAMLLNDGRHPYSNEVVVPADVLEFVSTGLVATHGKPDFPETSVKVYGAGQWRYSYQGLDIIEHGGNNPGFKTQVARFPGSRAETDDSVVQNCPGAKNHGLGIITLSNDGETGGLVLEAAKFRIAEDVLGLQEVDWTSRYRKLWNEYLDSLRKNGTSPPEHPRLPTADFEALGKKRFDHPAYGTLVPCLVPESMVGMSSTVRVENADQQSLLLAAPRFENPHVNCTHILSLPSSRRVLENSPLDRPTYIIQWDRSFSNIQRLTHFDGNLFNSSAAWSNANIRREEGYSLTTSGDGDDGDILIDLDQSFEVEWVSPRDGSGGAGNKEEGLSFRGNFWGKEGPYSEAPPEGMDKESAEVWFASSSL